MTRRWMAGLLAALIVAPAAAQGVPPDDAYGRAGADDAATLYEDVMVLIPMRALGLTDEQLDRLSEVNAELLAQITAFDELRERLWAEYQDDFEAVISARVAGRRVDGRARRGTDIAIGRLNDAQADLTGARADAARRFVAALSDDQQALVESEAAAGARRALMQRLGGFESVGEFVAAGLDALRDLMPEEYELVARGEAARMAAAIVGEDSPQLEAMTAAVLGIIAEVGTWTPPHYQEQRESLPAQIDARLGVNAGPAAPVTWDDIVRLVSSERTPAAIAVVRGSAEDEAQ